MNHKNSKKIYNTVKYQKYKIKVHNHVMDNLLKYSVEEVFTPSTPVEILDIFAGRKEQLKRISEAFFEKGSHIMLYGERGVGKTSIANITKTIFQSKYNTEIICIKINCNPNDTFNDLWYKIFDNIDVCNYDKDYPLTAKFEKEDLDSYFVAKELKQIDNTCLYIFDEFDQITDKETKENFTFLLKQLSDEGFKTKIMLVGIAENINELLLNHQSIERCLKEIKVQLMSDEEISEIIDKGLKKLNIEIDKNTKHEIIKLSEGYPRYTHLLAKYCCKHLYENEKEIITKDSLKYATERAIEDAQESIKNEYHEAIIDDRKDNYEILLLACALVEKDELGHFTHRDVVNQLKTISTQEIKNGNKYREKLNKLSSEEKGSILTKRGTNRYKYKFRNPLIQIYIKIKNYGDY